MNLARTVAAGDGAKNLLAWEGRCKGLGIGHEAGWAGHLLEPLLGEEAVEFELGVNCGHTRASVLRWRLDVHGLAARVE